MLAAELELAADKLSSVSLQLNTPGTSIIALGSTKFSVMITLSTLTQELSVLVTWRI